MLSRWRPAFLFTLALLLPGLASTGCALAPSERGSSMARYAPIVLPTADATARIQVRFAGVSTLLFDDGETAWMLDGFFTRPDKWKSLAGKIGPDRAIIEKNLKRLNVPPRLMAVVPAHSHYDHAMDAPVVASLTGARLIGSSSTINIGRGLSLPKEQWQQVVPNETVTLGKWKLTFILSRHSPTLIKPCRHHDTIDLPLVPPRHFSAWCAGEVWAILVTHDSGLRILVNASAGFCKCSLAGRQADVVFLGIGTLGRQSPAYREQLWNEVVRRVRPRRVIAIHWDDFSKPLDEPLLPMPYPLDDFDTTMSHLEKLARQDNIELRLPPLFSPFDPLAPLK
jgi:L-ascorbate metabolism protein UlaG (beta-lactamase superfamily)